MSLVDDLVAAFEGTRTRGYDRASRVAHHAHAHGIALRRAALEAGGVSEAEYDAWVDMRRMSMPG